MNNSSDDNSDWVLSYLTDEQCEIYRQLKREEDEERMRLDKTRRLH